MSDTSAIDKGRTKAALAGIGKDGDKIVMMLYVIAEGVNRQLELGFGGEQLLAVAGGAFVLATRLKHYLGDQQ